MSDMIAIKKVVLKERHLRPGRTKHFLCDSQGKSEFAPFTSLEIAQYPGDSGFYLLHLCENGKGTDTYHATLNDALHQAEFEFEVRAEGWDETQKLT